ncbi:D-2-hydroxyacid dehydrogenase [Flavihumibacter sp. RY-1]|uniref:D-2-hydroxyacid dehydrogenase n=1 Tax=Flavihumibacter fluminis TaxID=2909236 RepID=A0ABS9BH92_9BACT|nr:D-2-hydroxyacid dehydrogenase [Flavihumibacter fluminis]MCF1715077.1 D-2-hydroxyacid dehydrogenase [Flavihumibacter fluminis]
MKIVVLDGYTLNPGDLSWKGLEAQGTLIVYDRTAPDQVVERAKEATIVLTNKTALTADQLAELPELKFISVLATGFNIIDIEATKQLGITVSNVPGYSSYSVVQLCFALLFELTHRVQQHSDAVHQGQWVNAPDFSFWQQPLVELAGKKMGLIGLGDIGQKMTDMALALGMEVLAHSRTRKGRLESQRFKWVELDELFREADVVSLHCPLTPQTKDIINAARLRQMKQTSYLLNTARGPLIVEADLAQALNEGWIAGAGLDVLSVEPPSADNPLLTAKNCLITPHIAWASVEARTRLLEETIANVKAFIAGKPRNVIGL